MSPCIELITDYLVKKIKKNQNLIFSEILDLIKFIKDPLHEELYEIFVILIIIIFRRRIYFGIIGTHYINILRI